MKSSGRIFACFILCFLALGFAASAKVNPAKYGLESIPDSLEVTWTAADSFKSILSQNPMLSGRQVHAMEAKRTMTDKTTDFYMLLLVCLSLGGIRLLDPRFFQNMWKAFANPGVSTKIFKEKLDSSPLPNLLMNIFFAVVTGTYIYYLVRLVVPQQRTGNIAPPLLILMLIAGMGAIYLAKYALVRFSGWAFKIEGVTEHYIFNVFLINKILSLVLLPFVIVLAFCDPFLTQPAIILSLITIGILLINRYARSWKVYGSFFQYSRFHFFTYLCASELLPLAVLTKLLVRGLLY